MRPPFPSPPTPPLRPAGHRGAGPPPPPRQVGRPPFPREDRSARGENTAGPESHVPPPPDRCSHVDRNRHANQSRRTTAPHGPRLGATREHQPEQYGGHALHGWSDADATRFVACPRKAEERGEGRRTGRPPLLPPPLRPRRPAPRETHNPTPGRGKWDLAPPPPPKRKGQTEHGTEAGHAEGHGPRGTSLPAPSTGTPRGASATPPKGGVGRGRRESASTRTRKGHAGSTGRATGPSPWSAKTAWNDVPASEDKGHPDRKTRHTQRGNRGAGGRNGEDTTPGTGPNPPEPAAGAAHTRPGHRARQGSSGAPRHAPTPRLGSLRASPPGSHWRQASSTGLAAPAPLATTH